MKWTKLQGLADDSIRRLYNGIRDRVAKDAESGSPHRFKGDTASKQAERLREEMDRRRVKLTPSEW